MRSGEQTAAHCTFTPTASPREPNNPQAAPGPLHSTDNITEAPSSPLGDAPGRNFPRLAAPAAPNFSTMGGKNKWFGTIGCGRFQLLPIEMLILTFWGVGSSPSTDHQRRSVGQGGSGVWDGGWPLSAFPNRVLHRATTPRDPLGEGGMAGAGWGRAGHSAPGEKGAPGCARTRPRASSHPQSLFF